METIIICLIAGIGAGLGTGFAGMSAAVVISPMLVTFLDMNPFEAIGIALASDVLASAVSAYTYGKNGNVDIKRGKFLFISVLIFTVVGAIVSNLVPPATMGNLTVYMSLLMGIKFLVASFKDDESKQEVPAPDAPQEESKDETQEAQEVPAQNEIAEREAKTQKIKSIVCGAIIGFICGFIGAGGGIMMLILLTTVLGFELKTAVGTSVFIMTFTALFGAVSHFTLQGIIPDLLVMSLCVLFTLIFARLGSAYANKAETKQLNRATGIVLSCLGLFMIFA